MSKFAVQFERIFRDLFTNPGVIRSDESLSANTFLLYQEDSIVLTRRKWVLAGKFEPAASEAYDPNQDVFVRRLKFWFEWLSRESARLSVDHHLVLELSLAILLFRLHATKRKNVYYAERLRVLLFSVFSLKTPPKLVTSARSLLTALQKHRFDGKFAQFESKLHNEIIEEEHVGGCSLLVRALFFDFPLIHLANDRLWIASAINKSEYMTAAFSPAGGSGGVNIDPVAFETALQILSTIALKNVEFYHGILIDCLVNANIQFLSLFVRRYIHEWKRFSDLDNFHLPLLYLLTSPSSAFKSAELFPVTHARIRMQLAVELLCSFLERLKEEGCEDSSSSDEQQLEYQGLEINVARDLEVPDHCAFSNSENLFPKVKDKHLVLHCWTPRNRHFGFSFHLSLSDFNAWFPTTLANQLLLHAGTFRISSDGVFSKQLPFVVYVSNIHSLQSITDEDIEFAQEFEAASLSNGCSPVAGRLVSQTPPPAPSGTPSSSSSTSSFLLLNKNEAEETDDELEEEEEEETTRLSITSCVGVDRFQSECYAEILV